MTESSPVLEHLNLHDASLLSLTACSVTISHSCYTIGSRPYAMTGASLIVSTTIMAAYVVVGKVNECLCVCVYLLCWNSMSLFEPGQCRIP